MFEYVCASVFRIVLFSRSVSVCLFWQPLRAKHCKDCDRCVSKFDHHCLMIGTCIGERNHCRFWFFLLSQTITLSVALSIVSAARVLSDVPCT